MKVDKCPDEDCGGKMKRDGGIYVCQTCGAAFVPKGKQTKTIFSVT
jgi:hypothetical protein